ncbi:8599_t:CDS:2, partial [Gigaspora margarita]
GYKIEVSRDKKYDSQKSVECNNKDNTNKVDHSKIEGKREEPIEKKKLGESAEGLEESEDDKVDDSDEMRVNKENDGAKNDNKETTKKKLYHANEVWIEKFKELQGKNKWNKEGKGQPEKELTKIKDTLNIGDVSECMDIVEAIDTKLTKHLFNPGGRVEPNIQSRP